MLYNVFVTTNGCSKRFCDRELPLSLSIKHQFKYYAQLFSRQIFQVKTYIQFDLIRSKHICLVDLVLSNSEVKSCERTC